MPKGDRRSGGLRAVTMVFMPFPQRGRRRHVHDRWTEPAHVASECGANLEPANRLSGPRGQ